MMLERSGPFVLSVDELGTFLVRSEPELVIGHLREGCADLPFLADVGPRHALLSRRSSFRSGTAWFIAPLDGERVSANGEPVPEAGRRLHHGDQVELGVNLAFRCLRPDPASTSVVLELRRGAQCRGCSAIVLLDEGPSGRLRIGPSPICHLRAWALAAELVLELSGGRLRVSSKGGLAGAGEPRSEVVHLPAPPPRRVDLFVGQGTADRPPFALVFLPLEGRGARPA